MTERILHIINNLENGTVAHFAKKISFSSGNVHDWLSNKKQPSVKAIIKIHEVYNISLYWLIYGTGPMYDDRKPAPAADIAFVSENTPVYITQDDQVILDKLKQVPHMRKVVMKLLDAAIIKKSACDDIDEILKDL